MKHTLFIAILFAATAIAHAQSFAPISTTGYHLDAIAEATTAAANTSGVLDASDYVMYSAAYGTVYSTGLGLPNSGLLSTGTRSYQLQPYNADNVFYRLPGQLDTLVFTTPASYGALSLANFGTEGAPTMDVTVRFTDNSTEVFNGISLPDWFGTGNTILAGFDRCGRTSGTPAFNAVNPKIYYTDLTISCPNRSKQIAKLIIHNTGTGGRIVVLGVSGVAAPSFSVNVSPVTCAGGFDGAANIVVSGGLPPFGYTIHTTPPQFAANAANLAPGTYSYDAQDGAACPLSGTFAVTQSIMTQPSLAAVASQGTICAGKQVTLTAFGAATYTWNSGTPGASTVVVPQGTTIYTVEGITSTNCFRTGTVEITVNPLPVIDLSAIPSSVCVSMSPFIMTVTPAGGIFTGPGTSGSLFTPLQTGPGNFTIGYSYVDANGCSASSTMAMHVSSLAPAQIVSPGEICVNSAPAMFTVSAMGGSFSGAGIDPNTGAFTPSLAGVGSHTVAYTMSDGVCTEVKVSGIVVTATTLVNFTISKNNVCTNTPNYFLNASPAPGSYSGPGITGNAFSPAAAGAGTHTILYTYTNTAKCVSKASAQVTVSICTGISEAGAEPLRIFPNPVSGKLHIASESGGSYRLIDHNGKMVLQGVLNNLTEVDCSDLAEGIYTAEIVAGDHRTTRQRVVIAR